MRKSVLKLVLLSFILFNMSSCDKEAILDENPTTLIEQPDDSNKTPNTDIEQPDVTDNNPNNDNPNEDPIELNELEKKIKVLYELVISNSPYNGSYEEWVDAVNPPTNETRNVSFMIENDHLKWRYEDNSEWNTLVNLLTLLGGVTSIEGYAYDVNDELIMSFNTDSEVNLGRIDFFVQVEFIGYNGNLKNTQFIKVGKSATAPKVLPKEGYTFTNWDVDFSTVSNDMIVQAIFEESK